MLTSDMKVVDHELGLPPLPSIGYRLYSRVNDCSESAQKFSALIAPRCSSARRCCGEAGVGSKPLACRNSRPSGASSASPIQAASCVDTAGGVEATALQIAIHEATSKPA